MSMLPQGQSLRQFLPDADQLLKDPASYLRQGPIIIGPRQMYGLAGLFTVPALAFLFSVAAVELPVEQRQWYGGSCLIGATLCLLLGRWLHLRGLYSLAGLLAIPALALLFALVPSTGGERIALGVGFLIAATVWFGWSSTMRGHELHIHLDGVQLRYEDTTVWCPWALFNVDGEPLVPDSDSPRAGLTLPIAPDALPFVELRKNETLVAQGAQIEAKQWKVLPAGDRLTAVLLARYELATHDLGVLLLRLGQHLGNELPQGSPPIEAFAPNQLEEPPTTPEMGGWITVPVGQLRFPRRCCMCGTDTDETLPTHVRPTGEWFLRLLAPPIQAPQLHLPMCEECQDEHAQNQQRGGSWSMALGALTGLAACLVFIWFYPEKRPILFIMGLFAVAVGGLLGFLIGAPLLRRHPMQVRRYDPTTGMLTLRFRNPEYTQEILDTMRAEVIFRQRQRPLG